MEPVAVATTAAEVVETAATPAETAPPPAYEPLPAVPETAEEAAATAPVGATPPLLSSLVAKFAAQRRTTKPVAIVTPHQIGATAATARSASKRLALVEPHHGRDAERRGGAAVAAAEAADGAAAAVEIDSLMDRLLSCTMCDRKFSTPQGLSTHKFRTHGVRKADTESRVNWIGSGDQRSLYRIPASGGGESCPLCTERFVGKSALSRHIHNDHKDSAPKRHFQCDECDRAYKTYDCLQKHQRIDHSRGEVGSGLKGDWEDEPSSLTAYCPLCEAPFKTAHRLSMHILAEHKDTQLRHFRCEDCNIAFRTLEILRKHRKKHEHSAALPFPCDTCGMRFATWTGVITHQSQSHGKVTDAVRQLKPPKEKTVECPLCDERFECKRTLSDHIMSTDGHEELKHFECDVCKTLFRSFITMKCHRRLIHFRPGDLSFKFDCDVCTRRFRKWEGLRIHQMMMHGVITDATQMQMFERDYGKQCPLCKMFFQGAHSLSEHIAKAHWDFEGKLFTCDECDNSYRHYAHLRAHRHTKHNVPMKFKRTRQAGGRKKKSTVESSALTSTNDEEAQPMENGEQKGKMDNEVEMEVEGNLEEENVDDSDSYLYDEVMMSDIDSEYDDEEDMREEKEEIGNKLNMGAQHGHEGS